jgi:hypothetical protein
MVLKFHTLSVFPECHAKTCHMRNELSALTSQSSDIQHTAVMQKHTYRSCLIHDIELMLYVVPHSNLETVPTCSVFGRQDTMGL